MSTAGIIGTLLLSAAVIAALVVVSVRHPARRVVDSRFRERVIVTTKTGDSFAGILFESDSKALVLRGAEALGAGERKTDLPIDGELILLLPDVAYIQRP